MVKVSCDDGCSYLAFKESWSCYISGAFFTDKSQAASMFNDHLDK